MATVNDIINIINKFAPEEAVYDKEYDNIGLIIGERNANVDTVLCCLDVTMDIISQAEKNNAKMIISHHPIIYLPHLKNINSDTILGQKIIRLIKNGIAVYSAHTNLDFVENGINQYCAQLLGLKNIFCIEPYISQTQGFGRIGESKEISCSMLIQECKMVFDDPYCRLFGKDKKVRKIAIINGGGGGDTKYIDAAKEKGADCLITGDIKHHVALYAKEIDFPLIEIGHFASEHAYIKRMVQLIDKYAKEEGCNIKVIQAAEKNHF